MTAFQFYTGAWLKVYGVGTPNGALWTITVDIQFYIAAIFLAKWLKGRKIKTWMIVIVLTGALDYILEQCKGLYPELGYKILQCSIVSFIWIFLIGMCIYYNRDKLVPYFVKVRWGVIGLYLIWQYIVPDSFTSLFDGIRYNLVTTVLLLLMVTGLGFSFKRRFKQDYSYSFYLYHIVVINFVVHNICRGFAATGQFVSWFVITILTIGLLAVLSHKYIAGTLTGKIEKRLL